MHTNNPLGQSNWNKGKGSWNNKAKDSWADTNGSNGWGDTSANQDSGWGDTSKGSDGWGNAAKSKDTWGNSDKANDGWGNNSKANDGWGDSNNAANDWETSNGGGDWGDSQDNNNGDRRKPNFKKRFKKDNVDFNSAESKFGILLSYCLM